MVALDFYIYPGSAPCSAVQMTAKALGVELNLKNVDLSAGEQFKPEFLKVSIAINVRGKRTNILLIRRNIYCHQINPQHVIPTLVTETGVALWESRAIITYLVEKYGKNDDLYPSEPLKRAIVNQRLYFDMGTLYQRLMEKYYPMILDKFKGRVVPNADENLANAVDFLNKFLEGQNFVAGDMFTVADISTLATVSTLKVCGFDCTPYPNVVAWFDRSKAIAPGYEINEEHNQAFKKLFGK